MNPPSDAALVCRPIANEFAMASNVYPVVDAPSTDQSDRRNRSQWPAKLDVIQALSGLLLVLFIWSHMVLESSILLGKDAMYRVARFMEGRYLLGADYPILITCTASVIFAIFVVHAALAMRKFPASYRQYRAFSTHMAKFHHPDTTLWWLQVWTGFALLFLGSAHMIGVMTQPGDIGPYESADRVVSGWMWPVYALLLLTVHLHAGIGIYRLAVKWGLQLWRDPEANLRRLKLARAIIIAFFLLLGSASLGVYVAIGIDHRDHKGERYQPSWEHSTTTTEPGRTHSAVASARITGVRP
jgi:fumarate reductase subunit C